ncbi:hypothetical protein DMA12_40320 [Amycolatopsis balhimycina DSM 5908]|uniref:Core-binding (CB) domain-containing protein n=1 Tax=Amycolatopsis balhimycina DSM 5908 TaxID=1081091 RepID=A0A428W050_AMYBA|nr:hypothetical protein DMA12_40320 [Amycolatopsis balhimycina DSM 5908]
MVTVGQWLDIWLEMRQNLSFSTRRLYIQHVRDYLKPYLGSVPLRSLTVARVQAMFAALIRTNSSRTRPLSYATLQRVRGVLHAALNGAIRRGLLDRNPAHWIELPSGRRPRAVVWTEGREAHWRQTGERPAVAVWTPTQTAAFLESSYDHPLHVLYLLVALLGLRRGEAAGLRWCDIDNACVLQVSHQVQDHNGRTVICPLKTESSVRVLALDSISVSALRALRAERRRRLLGDAALTGFLFVNPAGSTLTGSAISSPAGRYRAATTAVSCWESTSATGCVRTRTPARSGCSATPTHAARAKPR